MNANFKRKNGSSRDLFQRPVSIADRSILHEDAFRRMLLLETKRAQRSQKPFLLSLFEMESHLNSEKALNSMVKVLSLIDSITRDTDVTGWYKSELVVGVMFTEIAIEDRSSIVASLMGRVSRTLEEHLPPREFNQMRISVHVFPQEEVVERISSTVNMPPLYADILAKGLSQRPLASDEARRLG